MGYSDGTHGTFHDATDDVTEDHLGETVSMDDAINYAQKGHQNAVETYFGERWFGKHCDPDCIKAQLKAFYKSMDCKPTVKDKVGGTDDQKVDVPIRR